MFLYASLAHRVPAVVQCSLFLRCSEECGPLFSPQKLFVPVSGENILQFCVDFFLQPPGFGLLLSMTVLQHYLYTADPVLSFMYRCCVVAVKRNVLQRVFLSKKSV